MACSEPGRLLLLSNHGASSIPFPVNLLVSCTNAASLASTGQIISLADEKSSAEDNASKAIALDHLGSFGARLRQSTVEVEARAKKDVERKGIGLTLQEVIVFSCSSLRTLS
jgi:hypothetical protein